MSDKNDIHDKEDNKEENEEEIITIPPENSNNLENGESKNKIICDFIIKQIIGEGTFATVRLAINRQTGEKVAIKIIEKNKISHEEDKIRMNREIEVLKKLRHPNIVHLYSVIDTEEKIYLITDYIKGIELFDYIVKKKKLTENESCIFFQQIISGIEYLHKIKYVHRDIKPENILVNEETKELKIVDFGLSNIFNNPNKNFLSSACGSPSYAAPEMLNGEKYKAPPVDIWSSGIVLYAMLCGYLPFEDETGNNDDLYDKICKGKYTIPNHVSDKAKDLLSKILVTDPKRRFTIHQIKNHPWFSLHNYKGKIMINNGLILTKYVIPIDQEIVSSMSKQYLIPEEKIRITVLSNMHNDISTIYYLLLNKKINKKGKSEADLKSNLFKKYCEDKNNLMEKYGKDLNNVIKERKNGYISNTEKKKNFEKNIIQKMKSKGEEIFDKRLNKKAEINFNSMKKLEKLKFRDKINETDINIGRKSEFRDNINNNSLKSNALKKKNKNDDLVEDLEKKIEGEKNNEIQEIKQNTNFIKYREKKVHNQKAKNNKSINNISKEYENKRIKSAFAPISEYKKLNNKNNANTKNSINNKDKKYLTQMKFKNNYKKIDREYSSKKNKKSILRSFKTPNKDIMSYTFFGNKKGEIDKNLNFFSENMPQESKEKLIIKIIKENKELLNKSPEESYKLFSSLSKIDISEAFYQKILKKFKIKRIIKKEADNNRISENNNITSLKKMKLESNDNGFSYSSFKIGDDSDENLLSYEPFDLNLLFIKSTKNLKEQIISLLDKNKIKYRIINNTRCIIELQKEKVNIDIKLEKLKLINEDKDEGENPQKISIIKLKKLNGGLMNNLKSLDKILFNIN